MTLSICLAWWHTLASVSFHCVLNYRQFLFISSVFISVCLHSPLVTELHFQRRIPMRLQQFHIYSAFDQSVHLLRERRCQYCLFLVAAEWSCLTWEIDSTKKSKKERGRESESRPEFHFHLKSFTFFFSTESINLIYLVCLSNIACCGTFYDWLYYLNSSTEQKVRICTIMMRVEMAPGLKQYHGLCVLPVMGTCTWREMIWIVSHYQSQ